MQKRLKLPNGFGSISYYGDNAGANETAVKRILGHASQGVTKGVYTHKSLHELKKAIDMI